MYKKLAKMAPAGREMTRIAEVPALGAAAAAAYMATRDDPARFITREQVAAYV